MTPLVGVGQYVAVPGEIVPLEPEINLPEPGTFRNGDFSAGLDGWEVGHLSGVSDQWDATLLQSEGQYQNVLDIWRGDSGSDGGKVWALQWMNWDVSQSNRVQITANVRVLEHTLEGSGWWSDENRREGEYPACISIDYFDAQGIPYRWTWGFLTHPNPNQLENYDLLPPEGWYYFTSHNILEVSPRPNAIFRVTLAGAGWDFHSQFNSVQLVVK